jgi:N-ethylmaleimide reductase
MEADYAYLARALNATGLFYIHLVDHSAMGAPAVPQSIKDAFREEFKGVLILSGGYDAARAESDLEASKADLIAVGRPLLANPDLVERWKTGAALNPPDRDTFYTPGAKGYTDYPVLAAQRSLIGNAAGAMCPMPVFFSRPTSSATPFPSIQSSPRRSMS